MTKAPWSKKAESRGGAKAVQLHAETPYVPDRSSRSGVFAFGAALFACVFAVAAVCCRLAAGSWEVWAFAVALVAGAIVASSVHIALSWERVVILRMGRVSRVAGPGIYLTVPLLEYGCVRIDQRTVSTPFCAERTLTADLVPVNIDAVLFWMVRDAEAACTEVEDYYAAISFLAQTAMREAVGRSTVAEVAVRRDELDVEIQRDIERQAAEWGIDIIAVKVRDIVLPQELCEAMSLEAQAEREKSARMTAASAEVEVAEMLEEAAKVYGDDDSALKLRTMLQQFETVKRSKSSVVSLPTAMSDGFVAGSSAQGSDVPRSVS